MNITEVQIKLAEGNDHRLLAYCSIVFDGSFVVRDLKIIQGESGPFISMPSKVARKHCLDCDQNNPVNANYCNHCGRAFIHDEPQIRRYEDIAFPTSQSARQEITQKVVARYRQACRQASG